jgi:short-subunit dehydrogenase
MREDQTVAGSTIVITGASSGFGRGTALELARQSANVVLAARRENVLDELASEISSAGGTAMVVPTDVSEAGDISKLLSITVERFGGVDVWINNVGIGALGLFWDIPIEDHARVVDVNLKGLIYGTHAAVQQFRKQGKGTLINIGSMDSEVPLAYQTSYAATKAAVLSLGRSLTEELRLAGCHDIKVGTIMPWAVDTPWWDHAANYTGHAPRMTAMDDPQIVIDAIVGACTDPKEKQPVGLKGHVANISHQIFPTLTERLSAKGAQREVEKADPVPNTAGSIYQPMASGTTEGGGIRDRMEHEDAEG